MAAPERITVGRIVRAHGVRGDLHMAPDTDFPDRLPALREVVLVKAGRALAARVTSVRPHGGDVLLKVEGIDTPEAASAWRGAQVTIARAEAMPLDPGRHYVFEVLGLRVETEDGQPLGTVTEVLRTGSNDVYVVTGHQGEVLVPAISTVVVEVDVAGGRIVIRPMDGLLAPR